MTETPRLTVGMACYDDYDGVWFTVMALRMFHAEALAHAEIVVVDNNPCSSSGKAVKKFVENWVTNGRYIELKDPKGTAAPRNAIFEYARGEWVICVDSHILLEQGALRKLLDYFEANPNSDDLLQGPLLYDDLKNISTHFDDQWRAQMWGVWGTDPRGERNGNACDPPPFEIPAQGLGLFACRKQSWLGFHSEFRGFGGEEFYIHEKYRQAGRKTLCLPFLRWAHRFSRPKGVSYPLTVENKLRNYLIGLTELGMPIETALNHFKDQLPRANVVRILNELELKADLGPDDTPAESAKSTQRWYQLIASATLNLIRKLFAC